MKIPEISNRVVKTGTGKTWDDWFSILDEAGEAKLGHRAIVAVLQKYYQVDDWWQQSITVAYERAREYVKNTR